MNQALSTGYNYFPSHAPVPLSSGSQSPQHPFPTFSAVAPQPWEHDENTEEFYKTNNTSERVAFVAALEVALENITKNEKFRGKIRRYARRNKVDLLTGGGFGLLYSDETSPNLTNSNQRLSAQGAFIAQSPRQWGPRTYQAQITLADVEEAYRRNSQSLTSGPGPSSFLPPSPGRSLWSALMGSKKPESTAMKSGRFWQTDSSGSSPAKTTSPATTQSALSPPHSENFGNFGAALEAELEADLVLQAASSPENDFDHSDDSDVRPTNSAGKVRQITKLVAAVRLLWGACPGRSVANLSPQERSALFHLVNQLGGEAVFGANEVELRSSGIWNAQGLRNLRNRIIHYPEHHGNNFSTLDVSALNDLMEDPLGHEIQRVQPGNFAPADDWTLFVVRTDEQRLNLMASTLAEIDRYGYGRQNLSDRDINGIAYHITRLGEEIRTMSESGKAALAEEGGTLQRENDRALYQKFQNLPRKEGQFFDPELQAVLSVNGDGYTLKQDGRCWDIKAEDFEACGERLRKGSCREVQKARNDLKRPWSSTPQIVTGYLTSHHGNFHKTVKKVLNAYTASQSQCLRGYSSYNLFPAGLQPQQTTNRPGKLYISSQEVCIVQESPHHMLLQPTAPNSLPLLISRGMYEAAVAARQKDLHAPGRTHQRSTQLFANRRLPFTLSYSLDCRGVKPFAHQYALSPGHPSSHQTPPAAMSPGTFGSNASSPRMMEDVAYEQPGGSSARWPLGRG